MVQETSTSSCFKKGLKNEEFLLALCNCFQECLGDWKKCKSLTTSP